MLLRNNSLLILLLISIQLFSQEVRRSNDYHLVYIALCEDDNTNYQKLVSTLKKINYQLTEKNQNSVLYFTKGMINFTTDQLGEWDQVYRLINGNSIIHLNVDDEINNLLKVFKKYEFSTSGRNNTLIPRYRGVVWDVFVGKGYWLEENNKNILGALVAVSGINVSYNFRLNIYHDSSEPLSNFDPENALGKYFSDISNKYATILKY